MNELQDIKAIVLELTADYSEIENAQGYFEHKSALIALEEQFADPKVWDDHNAVSELNRQKTQHLFVIDNIEPIKAKLEEAQALLELIAETEDEELQLELEKQLPSLQQSIKRLKLESRFTDPMDQRPAFLEIQSGSGGTEAQDWAQMLMRMYLKWGDQNNYQSEVLDVSPGEVAGIKHATIKLSGHYAFGKFRHENGIHRLVRKSPFDSGNRRHTSFASVLVTPELDPVSSNIEVSPSDLRIDTYRASGAGGQHVNKTDSAVRITHIPSGIVVQCQNEKSQHQNKAKAMAQLLSKLYEQSLQAFDAEKEKWQEGKQDITWGNQIRSYVLDDSRIKDLRTGHEERNCGKVLDGDINDFIEAMLIAKTKE